MVGCFPRKAQKTQESVKIDTLKLKEPVIIFEEEKETKEVEKPPEVTEKTEEIKIPRQPVYGYRVQIFAFESLERAEAAAQEARVKLDLPVYVEYVPPYYKVRVGDFLIREEAEAVRDRLRISGYRDAFIVETLIKPR
jgi:cell division septation protein DedD